MCFIMGNFNANLLSCDSNSQYLDFLNLLLSNSFLPQITKPTRISNSSHTLIYNIFTNVSSNIESGIVLSDLSDHVPVFAFIPNFHSQCNSSKQVSGFRNLSHVNIERFRQSLISTDWSEIYNCQNVNDCYNRFLEIFDDLYNLYIPICIPLRSNYKKVPRLPWVTKSLLKCINRKKQIVL